MSVNIKLSKGTKKATNFIKTNSIEDRLIEKIDRENEKKKKR